EAPDVHDVRGDGPWGHFLQVLIRGGFKSCNCKTEMLILRELPARFAQVLMLAERIGRLSIVRKSRFLSARQTGWSFLAGAILPREIPRAILRNRYIYFSGQVNRCGS